MASAPSQPRIDADAGPANHPRMAPPVLPPTTVSRPRLHARLDAPSARPITVVSAPSGSGKTLLAAGWAATQSDPVAWLSISPADREPRGFPRALVAAVRRAVPDAMADAAAMLRLPEFPSPDHAADVLASDLAALGQPAILVLDDVHLLEGSPSAEVLAGLLRHPPAGLRLVLVTRGVPAGLLPAGAPLPATIGDADLRLTAAEAAELAAATGAGVPESVVGALHARSEGWIAGLVLQLLGRHEDIGGPAMHVAADNERRIADLLIGEVLAMQQAELRELLPVLSVADRVDARLAAELAGPTMTPAAALDILNRLADRQVFTTRLDRGWFRLHSLFRSALLAELERRQGAERVAGLRRTAARWLAAEGLVDEALDQALAASDPGLAAEVVSGVAEEALLANRPAEVAQWIARLPAEVRAARPQLIAWQAWAEFHGNDFPGAMATTAQLESVLARPPAPLAPLERAALQAEADALRGHSAGWFGDNPTAIKRLEHALRRLPAEHRIARITALTDYASSIYARGERERGLRMMEQGLADPMVPPAAEWLYGTARWYLHYVSADVLGAEAAGRDLLRRANDHGNPSAGVQAHVAIGSARYERDDLDSAREHFAEALRLREHAPPIFELDASIGLALALQAAGQPDAAREAIDGHLADLRRLGGSAWMPLAESFRARLALRQGDLDLASRWLAAAGDGLDQPSSSTLERARLTQAQVLLALGGAANLALAEEVLRRQIADAADGRMAQRGIRSRAILALVLDARGDAGAEEIARELVAEAAGRGYVRLFLDLGPPMAALIRRSTRSAPALALLSRFAAASSSGRPAGSAAAMDAAAQVASTLTAREMQFLRALQRFATNKEIAAAMGVATPTVKRHAANLYGKLGAKNRREAVVIAQRLGLLPPDDLVLS